MGKPKTKNGLVKKMLYLVNHDGASIPVFIKGGGSGYIRDEAEIYPYLNDDDYTDVDYPSNEYTQHMRDQFADDWEDGMYICRLQHNNGYSQENFDIYFILWD